MQLRLTTMEPGQVALVKAKSFQWEDGVLTIFPEEGPAIHYSLAVVEWFTE